MNPAELIKLWRELKDTLGDYADTYLAEMIEEFFTPRLSMSETIDKYTMTEIIEHWFKESNDPHTVYEQLGEQALKLYFVNNRVVENALTQIAELEKIHRCGVTEEYKLLVRTMPMSKETISEIVKEVRDHVNNA